MHMICSTSKQVNCALTDDVSSMIVSQTGKKLSTFFNVKEKTVFNHEHDLMYYAKSPEKSYLHDYVDESGRRMLERAKYHIGRDISSHIFKHCVERDIIVTRKTGSLKTRAVDWQFLLSFIFDVGLTTNGPPNLHIINWRAW